MCDVKNDGNSGNMGTFPANPHHDWVSLFPQSLEGVGTKGTWVGNISDLFPLFPICSHETLLVWEHSYHLLDKALKVIYLSCSHCSHTFS